MKPILILLSGLISSMLYPAKSIALSQWPLPSLSPSYFYLAEKDGKKLYFLGTIHIGISLEDIDCSYQIEESVKTSDLVFTETGYLPVSIEDKKIFFLGSKEERDKLAEKLPEEWISIMSERREAVQRVENPYNHSISFSFEDLSPEVREFMISKGVNPEDSLSDSVSFLITKIFYEAIFSYPEIMDLQIGELAFLEDLPIEVLDDNSSIVRDLGQASSERPTIEISIEVMESSMTEEVYNMAIDDKKMKFQEQINKYKTERMEFEGLPEEITKNRNERWIDKIKQTREENPEYDSIFSAVGLGHLIGPYNLLDMLKEEGFSVSRIYCSREGGE